jgi:hypothetical protein
VKYFVAPNNALEVIEADSQEEAAHEYVRRRGDVGDLVAVSATDAHWCYINDENLVLKTISPVIKPEVSVNG